MTRALVSGRVATANRVAVANRVAPALLRLGGINHVQNPSFEVDTAAWGGTGTGSTITRVTSDFVFGAACGRMNTSADDQWISAVPDTTRFNTLYTFSVYLKGTVSETIHLNIWTGDTDVPGSAIVLTGNWQRVSTTQRTALTSKPELQIRRKSGDTTHPIFIDGAMIEEGPDLNSYFDGTFGSGFSWKGTAHNSISLCTGRKAP
jgi:hypothetical protein